GELVAAVDWFAQAEVAEPAPAPARRRRSGQRPRPAPSVRSRRRHAHRRVRAHIVWMVLFALLLAGVVAVNVAVLRAHVAVTQLDEQRAQLQAQNQKLASEVSAAGAAPRVEAAAHRMGLEQATDVVADPLQIADPRREARVAAKVLGIPVGPLYRKLADRSRGFVYVERKAPPARATALAQRNLTGFTFLPDERRVYPQGTV